MLSIVQNCNPRASVMWYAKIRFVNRLVWWTGEDTIFVVKTLRLLTMSIYIKNSGTNLNVRLQEQRTKIVNVWVSFKAFSYSQGRVDSTNISKLVGVKIKLTFT